MEIRVTIADEVLVETNGKLIPSTVINVTSAIMQGDNNDCSHSLCFIE